MVLDPQSAGVLSALVERVEDLTADIKELKSIQTTVATNTEKIRKLEKDNSGHHEGIQQANTFAATTKGGIKVLYAVILIFAGFISGISTTAVVLFFQDSKSLSALTSQVQDLRSDVNLLLGARK